MTDYKLQAENRLGRMNELFERAEKLQYSLSELQKSYGIIESKSFQILPQDSEIREEITNNFKDVFNNVKENVDVVQSAYNEIDIDAVIASMSSPERNM